MKQALVLLILALFGITAFSARHGIDKPKQKPVPAPKTCYVGGCSSEICSAEEGVVTPCIWREEYTCYADATCEIQKNGKCGWTNTPQLKKCLKNAASEPQPVPAPEPEPVSNKCYVGGCSGQICSDQEGAISTCIWREEYACYSGASCERQTTGECGWTSTPELKECLEKASEPQPVPLPEPEPVSNKCYVGGCSGQICSDQEGAISTCIWREEYACYADATCERQADGECGWTSTSELKECLENASDPQPVPLPEPEPVANKCYVGGCSGQLCTDQEDGGMSTCEWREEYACYSDATCERQADGQCGWTSSTKLDECLANASSNNAV